jgi:ADP-ribose pyrophosphatase YjhB (NUDIX family)
MLYTNQEANWGPVIPNEVPQGSHLTLELPLRYQNTLVALLLKEGIHGADNSKLFFPHGLIRFGESIETALKRIVREIACVDVLSFNAVSFEAWLDDEQHYHICATLLARISQLPVKQGNIADVIAFRPGKLPDRPFAWWANEDIHALFRRQWDDI